MKPTPWATAPSIRGEAVGPDLRELFQNGTQIEADCLARIEAFGGPFREDGRDWLVEAYQELLDCVVYLRAWLSLDGKSCVSWVAVVFMFNTIERAANRVRGLLEAREAKR